MSKLWTNQFGEGRESIPRGLRSGRGVFSLCLALGLLVSAGSAWAAEVVEVRVGRHPEFTRLVFELDRAVGYRIQRTDAGADSELVISLEASSIPRSLRSSKTLIEQVDVSPSGSRSVARIKLTEDGFRLKEMILSNPPRIVLDLVSEKSVAKAASKAASTASRTTPKPVAKPVAKATPKPAVETTRVAKASEAAKATAAAATAQAKSAAKAATDAAAEAASKSKEIASNATAAASEKVAEVKKKAEEISFDEIVERNSKPSTDPSTEPSNTIDPSDLVARTEEATQGEVDAAAAKVAEANEAMQRAPAPDVVKTQPKPKTPRPMVAKKETEDDQGWMKWALIAGGALVIGGAGLLFAGRRRGSEEVDFSDEEDEVDFGDDAVTGIANEEDENPFADLASTGDAVDAASADATTVTPFAEPETVTPLEEAVAPFADEYGMDGEGATSAPIPDDEKESETVVFESAQENDMDDMEVISRDQVNESLGDAAMPPMGGIPEEFQQMMREMNRRVESLEGRIDELVDARDRLERQVAAQTEELRVQRAAIARTQRAVRNLARPEDAGEEEATEPALRDPNQ